MKAFSNIVDRARATFTPSALSESGTANVEKQNKALLKQVKAWATRPSTDYEARDRACDAVAHWLHEGDESKALSFIGMHLTSLPPLPPNVRKLHLGDNVLQSNPTLPEGLTEFASYNSGVRDGLVLPPTLTSLTLAHESHLTHLTSLPPTLTYLAAVNNSNLRSLGADPLPNLVEIKAFRNRLESISNAMPDLVKANFEHNRIQSVPGLNVASNLRRLDLSDNRLRNVPGEFFALPANATIELEGNELSASVVRQIQERTRQPGYQGPRMHVSIAQPRRGTSARPLRDAIADWNLPNRPRLSGWTAMSREEHAGDFSRFLDKLKSTVSARDVEFREQIHDWLHDLGRRPELRALTFAVANESTRTCQDRVTLTYSQMQTARLTADAQEGKYNDRLPDLIEVGRSMFRMEALEKIAHDKVAKMTGAIDEIEVYLGYQVKLRDSLKLQTAAPKMAYFEHHSGLHQADLDAAKHEVRHRENKEFPAFFSKWGPWHAVLEQINPGALDNTREMATDQLDRKEFKSRVDRRLAKLGLGGDADAERAVGKQLGDALADKAYLDMTRAVLNERGQAPYLDHQWRFPSAEQRLLNDRHVLL